MTSQTYRVTLRFQHPAHDEKHGIIFYMDADSKAQAIAQARWQAKRDGHLPCIGKGRATFSAVADSRA